MEVQGAPFDKTLNYINMVSFLFHFLPKQETQEPKNETPSFSTEINQFTTNKDQTLKNCENKRCVLAFFRKEFDSQEKLSEVVDTLKKVQGYFNKNGTEVYLLDAGCYYDKLASMNLSWDYMPNLVVYDRAKMEMYPLMDKFDEQGIKRTILKVEKNLIQKKKLDDYLVFINKDCQEENKKLKESFEKLKQTQKGDEDDDLINEVIQQSQQREQEKQSVKLSKKERRKQRMEERKKREAQGVKTGEL